MSESLDGSRAYRRGGPPSRRHGASLKRWYAKPDDFLCRIARASVVLDAERAALAWIGSQLVPVVKNGLCPSVF